MDTSGNPSISDHESEEYAQCEERDVDARDLELVNARHTLLADQLLVRIRTDLDSFSEAEMSVLENHGYFAAERSIRKHAPELIAPESKPAEPPYAEWIHEGKVGGELRDSRQRISLRRMLRTLGVDLCCGRNTCGHAYRGALRRGAT